jgi:spore germination cell wall hydrolase CwlJ-like protein
LAVGQVILNRTGHSGYPKTVCEVVFQNKHLKNRCQFSFACDGQSDVPGSQAVWQRSKKEAEELYACDAGCRAKVSDEWQSAVWSSTHYHAASVSPGWAPKLKHTASIGHHIFYRES